MELKNNLTMDSQDKTRPDYATVGQLNQISDKVQLNDVFHTAQKQESPLLRQVRTRFGVFGGISLIFGVFFALLFYKAYLGLNAFVFTLVIISLMFLIMNKLDLTVKKGTKLYYAGAALLGLSTLLTSSDTLHFLNVIGIMILLDLSLLHQFYDNRNWDFMKHLLQMLALPFLSIGAIGLPFMDCIRFMKKTKVFKNEKVRNIFLGILISIPFLWVITALLVNADLMFGRLAENILDTVFQEDIFIVVFMTVFGFLSCYCVLCAAVCNAGIDEKKPYKRGEASIAVTVMVILTLVYLIFCGIQIVYLFAGGLFVLPEGYTFAEYARRGFFELLAVAVINVALMVLCRALFEDSKVLRTVITVMTVCTYIMIASAAYRMLLYIGAYHLTFLRVFVLLSLFIIALVLAGIIAAQYREKFPLFRYCVAVTAVCYIIFAFSRPDYYIAAYLVEHAEELNRDDIYYLYFDLSLDAAPVVLPLLEDKDQWTMSPGNTDQDSIRMNYTDTEYEGLVSDYRNRIEHAASRDIREFNYSVYTAGNSLEKFKN